MDTIKITRHFKDKIRTKEGDQKENRQSDVGQEQTSLNTLATLKEKNPGQDILSEYRDIDLNQAEESLSETYRQCELPNVDPNHKKEQKSSEQPNVDPNYEEEQKSSEQPNVDHKKEQKSSEQSNVHINFEEEPEPSDHLIDRNREELSKPLIQSAEINALGTNILEVVLRNKKKQFKLHDELPNHIITVLKACVFKGEESFDKFIEDLYEDSRYIYFGEDTLKIKSKISTNEAISGSYMEIIKNSKARAQKNARYHHLARVIFGLILFITWWFIPEWAKKGILFDFKLNNPGTGLLISFLIYSLEKQYPEFVVKMIIYIIALLIALPLTFLGGWHAGLPIAFSNGLDLIMTILKYCAP